MIDGLFLVDIKGIFIFLNWFLVSNVLWGIFLFKLVFKYLFWFFVGFFFLMFFKVWIFYVINDWDFRFVVFVGLFIISVLYINCLFV